MDPTAWAADAVFTEYTVIVHHPSTTARPESRGFFFALCAAVAQRLFEVAAIADGVWATVLYMSYATVQKNIAFKEML